MRDTYGIQGYPRYGRRGTRGKGRKINYKEKPRNLGKLLEEAIDHLSTHDCKECGEIINSFKELGAQVLQSFGEPLYNALDRFKLFLEDCYGQYIRRFK